MQIKIQELTVILQAGEMLYCYDKRKTSCCFINEKCSGEWDQLNDEMTMKAIEFMRDPQRFLTNLVENAGYDTCHLTKEYDAEKCNQDCENQALSYFAKNCSDSGGLYKCCIR